MEQRSGKQTLARLVEEPDDEDPLRHGKQAQPRDPALRPRSQKQWNEMPQDPHEPQLTAGLQCTPSLLQRARNVAGPAQLFIKTPTKTSTNISLAVGTWIRDAGDGLPFQRIKPYTSRLTPAINWMIGTYLRFASIRVNTSEFESPSQQLQVTCNLFADHAYVVVQTTAKGTATVIW